MVERSGTLLLVRLVVLLVAAHNSCRAQQCSEVTAEELDGVDGLISAAYASNIGGDNPTPPDVELLDFNVVCLATSERSGFYRFMSLVANHTCQSSKPILASRCDGEPVVAQFTFGCSSGSQMWVPIVAGSSDHIIRVDPLATLNTQLRKDCFACVDPGQSPVPVDSITHCLACDAECSTSGSGQCLDSSGRDNDCCRFFESDGVGCVDECGPNQEPDENFVCRDVEIFVGFELDIYTFIESNGMGTVRLSPSRSIDFNFSIAVMGGPGGQPEDVIVSGSDVMEDVNQLPAAITFMINDDMFALEGTEVYVLRLEVTHSDFPLTLGGPGLPDSAQISIVDDDEVIFGFLSVGSVMPPDYDYSEADTNAFVSVGRSNPLARPVNVTVMACRSPMCVPVEDDIQYLSRSLQLPEDPYVMDFEFVPGAGVPPFIEIPLNLDDDDVALEDDEIVTFFVTAQGLPGVEMGGVLEEGGVLFASFHESVNVTITDNDTPTVGFQEQLYEFIEGSGDQVVTVVRVPSVARPFTVRVSGAPSSQEGLVISGPSFDDVVMFGAGSVSPFINIPFPIQDDAVPGEPLEVYNMTLSEPSDPRVMIGGSVEAINIVLFAKTEINIADNDVIEITTLAPPLITTVSELTTSATTVSEPTTSVPPILRNHTVIGDPLFTVPFLVDGEREVLCYEIHGQPSQHFNLISDTCVSVAAEYVQVYANSTDELLNVIGEVGVLAIDNAGKCVRVSIEAESCLAAVDSVPVDVLYMSQGVRVRKGRNYVRVSVPNCADSMLTMWILCRNFDNNAMIKFVVTRGINLRETSHGLIGQFWNVPYSIENFSGEIRNTEEESTENLYMVTVQSPSGEDERTFPVWREEQTWEGQSEPCLYAGNRQGGKVYEVASDHDSVIEGSYRDYRLQDLFATQFMYSHFDDELCTL